MRNLSETETYSFTDHILSRAVFALSRVVGVKNITRPFWNRWRAALFDQNTLDRFLAAMHGLSDWPTKGMAFLQGEIRQVEAMLPRMSDEEAIAHYRRLSFLAHLVQWGCLPLSDAKTIAYRHCRDFYVEAERRAFGARFARLRIDWQHNPMWANLHLPQMPLSSRKSPLVVIVHGMDDVKEEHLASELLFMEAGFAVLCIDGPGQGESFLIDGTTWPENFDEAIVAAVDALSSHPQIDTEGYAIAGISWGGMWAYKIAAADARVSAILDLGGPVDARDYNKLPFFLKSKFCQILGITSLEDARAAADHFAIRDVKMLGKIRARVHIVHGGRDPLVSVADKTWLRDTLNGLGLTDGIKLTLFDDGDHCCTQYVTEIRRAAAAEFLDAYTQRTGARCPPDRRLPTA
ncbi:MULTISPECIES: alpha/beta hydrolase family protein [unclassified Burkholderia]|uniref:alpha/beta hydrolase family protein n=1 Tax=unclassified Burkholderia TaxID=2613784 RepID=UPI002AB04708|nr:MULTISPECIES: alpha/beta fold hydrolase [unclassified Burkholderia]